MFGWLKELERWKSEVEEEDRKKRKTKEGSSESIISYLAFTNNVEC